MDRQRLVRAARRATRSSLRDYFMFGKAYLSLAIVDVRLRRVGFAPILTDPPGTGDEMPQAPSHEQVADAIEYATWLEKAASIHFVRAHCLHRALALYRWTRRQNLQSQFRIGVQ